MLAVELLSEPVVVSDTYVSGLADIEDLGDGLYRFTFYAKQRSTYGGEDHIVALRLVMGTAGIWNAVKMTMKVLGFACCGAGRMKDRH